jgi:predicted GNAT superfamily acetyltransferase
MEYRLLEQKQDFEQAIDLEIAVWGLDPRDATPANLMLALHHAGGVTIGAYDRKQLIGITFAFPFRKEDRTILWSHSTGVHRDYQGQGIGYQLKLYQRDWALANGYGEIGWTFDPLQRGNANFNLHRLGAHVQSYQVNFYGVMQDEINHGEIPSDRLEAVWHLNDAAFEQDGHSETRMLPYLLMDEGLPKAAPIDTTQPEYLVQIPRNLTALPNTDALLTWRLALREAFTNAFDCGYVAVDFTDTNAYLLRRS